MRQVRVIYHGEPEGWWADSPDLPGWIAAGGTFEEARIQALTGVPEFCEEPCIIAELGVPVATTPNSVERVADVLMQFTTSGTEELIEVEFKGFYEVKGEPRMTIADTEAVTIEQSVAVAS